MSLINCPECGKEMSDTLSSCPHCGYRFAESNNKQQYQQNEHKKKKTGIVKYIVAIVIICFIIGSIATNISNKNNNTKTNNSNNSTINNPISSGDNEKMKKIKVGDTITTNSFVIKIKKIEFSYDVLPDDTSGIYTHYESDNGNVYINIDADIKNTGKQNLQCDNIGEVIANYNDGYTYKSFTVPEDSQTGFTYANITSIKPLETLGVHFLIECPQEVEESNKTVEISMNFENDKYTYLYNMK